LTRLLACLALAPAIAAIATAAASCDTGGEPPLLDSGKEVGTVTDGTTADTPITREDSMVEASTNDVVDGGEAGDAAGDVSCTPACPSGEQCLEDGGCAPCGAEAGQYCCEGTCPGASSLVCSHLGRCTSCGGPGEPCCALNTCGDGGCCQNDSCTAQGESCQGIDGGGTCQAGACGGPSGCGVSGGPCCVTWCTAPQTRCEGSDASTETTDAGSTTKLVPGQCLACGNGGQSCCAGSSCAGSLTCASDICVR
jgi:hypothetical protein